LMCGRAFGSKFCDKKYEEVRQRIRARKTKSGDDDSPTFVDEGNGVEMVNNPGYEKTNTLQQTKPQNDMSLGASGGQNLDRGKDDKKSTSNEGLGNNSNNNKASDLRAPLNQLRSDQQSSRTNYSSNSKQGTKITSGDSSILTSLKINDINNDNDCWLAESDDEAPANSVFSNQSKHDQQSSTANYSYGNNLGFNSSNSEKNLGINTGNFSDEDGVVFPTNESYLNAGNSFSPTLPSLEIPANTNTFFVPNQDYLTNLQNETNQSVLNSSYSRRSDNSLNDSKPDSKTEGGAPANSADSYLEMLSLVNVMSDNLLHPAPLTVDGVDSKITDKASEDQNYEGLENFLSPISENKSEQKTDLAEQKESEARVRVRSNSDSKVSSMFSSGSICGPNVLDDAFTPLDLTPPVVPQSQENNLLEFTPPIVSQSQPEINPIPENNLVDSTNIPFGSSELVRNLGGFVNNTDSDILGNVSNDNTAPVVITNDNNSPQDSGQSKGEIEDSTADAKGESQETANDKKNSPSSIPNLTQGRFSLSRVFSGIVPKNSKNNNASTDADAAKKQGRG